MEFNTLIKTKFFPILKKYNFEIAEEFKNILRFQSFVMKVNIVFNQYDKSFLVEIGIQDDTVYPLGDCAVKELFNSSLSIEQVTPEIFVQNLSTLFETKEGISILQGNVKSLKSIVMQQSENYTGGLLLKQTLEISAKAWEANDYAAFVESIDKIGIANIPQSYQLKYKIAKQKL